MGGSMCGVGAYKSYHPFQAEIINNGEVKRMQRKPNTGEPTKNTKMEHLKKKKKKKRKGIGRTKIGYKKRVKAKKGVEGQ